MQGKSFFLLCWVGIAGSLLCFNAAAATKQSARRGVKPLAAGVKPVDRVLYAESHALVIGVSKYEKGWRNLPGVNNDLPRVKEILIQHGFHVESLENPTGSIFRESVKRFISDYGGHPRNRLLVYFAGHGFTHLREDGLRDGYLIPADTPLFEAAPSEFRNTAISMVEMQGYARMIEARHALFVFDSCFSGALFEVMRSAPRVEKARKLSPLIAGMIAAPVRQFITSGTEEQQVADRSIFCEEFVRGLKGEADLNRDKYVTGSELGMYVEDRVTAYYDGGQTPRYGKLYDAKLNKGDFVFALKSSATISAAPEKNTTALEPTRLPLDKPLRPNPEADLFYETGLTALRQGSYYKASKALAEVIKRSPEFPFAYAQRAEALLELDYQEAAKDLLLLGEDLPEKQRLSPTQQLYLRAMNAVALRNFDQAIQSYSTLLAQVPTQDKSYILFDLGRAYEKNEQIDLALATYQKSLQLDPNNATAWLRLGILYGRKRQDANAEKAFGEAQRLYETLSNLEGQAEIFYQRGFLARNRTRLAEARELLSQALDLAKVTGNKAQQALATLHLGSIDLANGKLAQARKSITKVKELTQAEGMQEIYLRALVDLGHVLVEGGKLEEAESYFQQAFTLARRQKARRNQTRAQFSLGSVHYEQGRVDETVVREITEALEFYQRGGYRIETLEALILLARVERKKRNYEAARQRFTELAALAEQWENKRVAIYAREGSAAVMMMQGQYPQASAAYQDCLTINRALQDEQAIVYNLLNLGNLAWRIGEYQEADKFFAELSQLLREKEYEGIAISLHLARAEMRLSQRSYAKARREWEQVTLKAKEPGKLVIDATDEESIIELYRLTALLEGLDPEGNKDKSRHALKEAMALVKKPDAQLARAGILLAQAEVELNAGQHRQALEAALAAQSLLTQDGQGNYLESLWRSYQFAALASQELQRQAETESYKKQAQAIWEQLKIQWENHLSRYQTRPDVTQYLQRLRP